MTAKHHLQDRHIQLTPMFFFCLTIIFKLPKCISDSCVCVFSEFTVMSVEETAKIIIKTYLIQFNVDKTTKQTFLAAILFITLILPKWTSSVSISRHLCFCQSSFNNATENYVRIVMRTIKYTDLSCSCELISVA